MPITRRTLIRQAGTALLTSRFTSRLSGQLGAPAGSRDAYAIPHPIPAGPFSPTWESLRDLYRVPSWFHKAKFGIFIHWGLYSIPAHGNEWYERHMYQERSAAKWHAEHYGPTDKFGYKDFIPLLTVPNYRPAEWADLFANSGAKYVVPVAEHHDGFAMYDSDLTPWCAGKMGPKRDLMGELAREVRKRNLIFGCSSHRMEHDSFAYPANSIPSDEFDPKYAGFYGPPVPGEFNNSNASSQFQEDWLARVQELIDKYEPQMIYFDNGVNTRAYDDVKLRAAAYYYNRAYAWGKGATLATKDVAYLFGSVQDFEKQDRAPKAIYNAAGWQCDDSIGSTWGYTDGMTVRSAASMLRELIQMVSLGGNLLLNISPMGDGSIPIEQQRELLTVGEWLRANGEGIYGAAPWLQYGEGPGIPPQSPGDWKGGSTDKPGPQIARHSLAAPTEHDFRFTAGTEAIYAFGCVRTSHKALLTSFAAGRAKIERVTLLETGSSIAFRQTAAGLETMLPAPQSEEQRNLPYCLKIQGSMPLGRFV